MNRPHDIQRATIRDLIHHLHAHEQYVAVFETYYLGVTKAFYAAESLQKYEQNTERASDALAFVEHCGKRGEDEDEMCRAVLLERSWPLAKQAVERSLLDGRLKWLAEKGEGLMSLCHLMDSKTHTLIAIGLLMVQKDIPKMTQLYGLFSRNGGVKILCHYFKLYIDASGPTLPSYVMLMSCLDQGNRDCPRYDCRREHGAEPTRLQTLH